MAEHSRMLYFRLPPDLDHRVRAAALTQGMTVSDLLREMVEEHFGRLLLWKDEASDRVREAMPASLFPLQAADADWLEKATDALEWKALIVQAQNLMHRALAGIVDLDTAIAGAKNALSLPCQGGDEYACRVLATVCIVDAHLAFERGQEAYSDMLAGIASVWWERGAKSAEPGHDEAWLAMLARYPHLARPAAFAQQTEPV